jgi:hypothetical protein
MSDRRQQLIGKRFGRGIVTGFLGKLPVSNFYVWELICDCGNVYKSTTSNLNFGHVTSCGCYKLERVKENIKKATLANTMPLGIATFNELLRSYKKRAIEKGLCFELTQDQFEKLTKSNCVYCGQEPSGVYRANTRNGEYIYNGVDRIDSTLGYTVDNCIPCCKRCNQGKNNMPYDEFMNWIARVYSHSCIYQSVEVSHAS